MSRNECGKGFKIYFIFSFCYLIDEPGIVPAPEPFTAGIYIEDLLFYVYVERNGVKDLSMFLKWKKNFSEKMFIITEKIDYIKELELFIETEKLRVRAILDGQLKHKEFDLYHFEPDNEDGQKWIKS